MGNKNESSGCYLIFLGIILIPSLLYTLYDHIFEKPERDIKENSEFIAKWGKSNIDYFRKFECPYFNENEKEIQIKKFYVFWTAHQVPCENIKKMFYKFSNSRHGINNVALNFENKKFEEYKTEIIDSSNVLIWIKTIEGELEGHYNGGSRAIRLNNEINFIETKTNKIFKKVIIKCIGEPQDEVMEGQTEKSKDYYFGSYSKEEIAKIIENELKKNE